MDLALILDKNALLPLHRQLYEELRRAILTGRLLPKQRLPSTRSLAKSLGISRATVTLSYEQLLSEGYLETAPSSGTFVCAQLPDDLLQAASVECNPTENQSAIALSTYGMSLKSSELLRVPEPEAEISFRYGQPAVDEFPLDLWRKLLSRHCYSSQEWLHYATDARGYGPLREAIAQYLSRARAVQCDASQIIVVGGSQQALDLIGRVLINRGDAIALEDPGYLGARRTFSSQGAKLYPIPVDESGLVVQKLADAAYKLVYVTPSHQFPTGAVLSLSRRLELLAWAQQAGAIIVEDDYDSEYRYVDRPIPALQGLDRGDRVLYVGTFSKVLFPGLRLGYLVVPPSLVEVFTRAKWVVDRQCPFLEQAVLADFIIEGHLERHIRRMRQLYDRRRRSLVEALLFHLGKRVTILGENAGIHLMARLQTGLSDVETINKALEVGVGLVSANAYYLNGGSGGEFIFGYAELTELQIQAGIRRLAQVLN